MLYPLKFEPILKEKIWGGNYLYKTYSKGKSPQKKIGESWELSTVGDDVSIVSNGAFRGKPLTELLAEYRERLVGKHNYARFKDEFPILVKLIDANDHLSVQVHPDEETAQRKHQKHGKSEMWYVLHSDADAKIIAGLEQHTSKEIFAKSIVEGTTEHLLRKDASLPGDVFYIPAGRIHAIGSGNVVMEVQQTSDVTYRVYDYDRKDDSGSTRELHVCDALEVSEFNSLPSYKTPYELVPNETVQLVDSPHFTTNKLFFDQALTKDYSSLDSFVALFAIKGEFSLQYEKCSYIVKEGELILLPAETRECVITPDKAFVELLEVFS